MCSYSLQRKQDTIIAEIKEVAWGYNQVGLMLEYWDRDNLAQKATFFHLAMTR
jgi:hypothetical protein